MQDKASRSNRRRVGVGGLILSVLSACGSNDPIRPPESESSSAMPGGMSPGAEPMGMGPDLPGATPATPGGPSTEGNPTPGGLTGNVPPGGMMTPPGMPVPPLTPPIRPPGFAVVEALDRGMVAVVQPGGVYVGWRMFGDEYDRDQPELVSYDLYRDDQLIANVTDSTNFFDAQGTPSSGYSVAFVREGVAGLRSTPIQAWAQNFQRIPITPPGANYTANDSSVGDVDGDGDFELFLIWQPNDSKDNSQAGVTGDVFIDALEMDGTQLWRINLGPNIRAGAHYDQIVVIDADGDGRAEMGVKTAPGTRDGEGNLLRLGPAATDDDSQIFRNADGYVLTGPEYFTIFEGATGRELSTVAFDQARGNVNAWGDGYGNRVDRFLATAAYLDDTGLPSIVMTRGYYTRSTLTAWNWRDGALTRLWKFDSDQTPRDANNQPFTGQGAHSLSVANVDADPEQEIIYGQMTVDHDGRGMCSTGRGHGDSLHVGDFVPSRPGLEAFMPAETTSMPFWSLRDPATCQILQTSDQTGQDVGRAVADDISAANPGAEFWASAGVALRSATTGAVLGGPQPNSINFLIWWDADELRELEDGNSIRKLGVNQPLQACAECSSNNGTKSTPTLVADLLGDWREEIIWRETGGAALRIYTTTAITERRIYTLMHDPQYRAAISWQNVGYNQPPPPSCHSGAGRAAPPTPDIRIRGQAQQ
ncbi:MAG: hypothetical protein RL033_370 [Pseudomonadota bacterium]